MLRNRILLLALGYSIACLGFTACSTRECVAQIKPSGSTNKPQPAKTQNAAKRPSTNSTKPAPATTPAPAATSAPKVATAPSTSATPAPANSPANAPANAAGGKSVLSEAPANPAAKTTQGSSAEPAYLLRYKLKKDDELRFEVTHLGKTDTRMQGKEESMTVRTVSTKVWRVTDVAEDGTMTFEHLVEHVQMTQQADGGAELRWDSKSDQAPPAAFEKVASSLGVPLCRVTINGQGQVIKREDFAGAKANLGMGELVLSLPKDPLKVGGNWAVPRELRIRDKNGDQKLIKVREVYTLERVATGVATISLRTEPLTPISEPSEKAQLVQQISNGTLRFDMDAGRMLSKQLDWDEEVVGFQGADSMMKYLSRMTEEASSAAPRSAKADDAAKR